MSAAPDIRDTGIDDDDGLLIRLQNGDADGFSELVDRHNSPLIGFFFRNTRDRQLSEDLAQETLLRIYNEAWDYLPQGRFRPWMYRIARNLLIDDVRRRSHDALVRAARISSDSDLNPLAQVADDVVPVSDTIEREEVSRAIDEALEEIPEDQRLTFTLHYHAGLSLPEIAQILDVTVSTCKSRLRLAREKLREKLRLRGLEPADAAVLNTG